MVKAVRQTDIAKALNVSNVTVSKALADKEGVSEEMRRKIKDLAKEMGYKIPSSKAESELTGKHIGVISSEKYLSRYTSFYWELYQNIVTQSSEKDSFTLLEVLSKEDEKNLLCPRLIKEKKVDGLIIIGKINRKYRDMLSNLANVPMLFLDFYDDNPAYDSIISNSYYGMYVMTNYLFNMGHKDIAYVGSVLATSSITDRYFGYAKSLLEHGVSLRKDWIIPDRDEETGDIVIHLPDLMPTAFVCNCDFVASVLIKELQSKGYKVPDDISVVGFDNFLFPGLSDIGITTYEVDIKEMAKAGIETIISKIENEYKSGISLIEGRIIYKESVKAI